MSPNSTEEASSRVQLVYGELFRAISNLELGPGAQLVEKRLADHLGVSRTPIRQALHQLEIEGLIEQGSGRTYVVRGLTLRDVHEICDLLEVLDRYVVSAAMRAFTDEDSAALVALTREMRAAVEEAANSKWDAADKQFHDLLQARSDNALVAGLLAKTRARIHKFWANSVSEERLRKCSAEHEEIALAIRDGNEEQALALVSEHVGHMRTSLSEILKRAAVFLPHQWPGRIGFLRQETETRKKTS